MDGGAHRPGNELFTKDCQPLAGDMKTRHDKLRLKATPRKLARGKTGAVPKHTSMKAPTKTLGGRPTVYLPKFCKEVIEFMSQGFSLSAFAGTIGVSRETIYAWSETIKEFGEALKRARAARTLYWEKRLKSAEKDTRAVIFALRNACSEEWKDKPDVAVTVHNDVTVDTTKPPEEWGEGELRAELARRGALPGKIKPPKHD
jgi:hypothetical protein